MPGVLESEWGALLTGFFQSIRAAQMQKLAPIVGHVANDARDPRAHACRIAALANPFPATHERVLADVFGIGAVAELCERDEKGHAKVPPHQEFECRGIPHLNARHELGVWFGHASVRQPAFRSGSCR